MYRAHAVASALWLLVQLLCSLCEVAALSVDVCVGKTLNVCGRAAVNVG